MEATPQGKSSRVCDSQDAIYTHHTDQKKGQRQHQSTSIDTPKLAPKRSKQAYNYERFNNMLIDDEDLAVLEQNPFAFSGHGSKVQAAFRQEASQSKGAHADLTEALTRDERMSKKQRATPMNHDEEEKKEKTRRLVKNSTKVQRKQSAPQRKPRTERFPCLGQPHSIHRYDRGDDMKEKDEESFVSSEEEGPGDSIGPDDSIQYVSCSSSSYQLSARYSDGLADSREELGKPKQSYQEQARELMHQRHSSTDPSGTTDLQELDVPLTHAAMSRRYQRALKMRQRRTQHLSQSFESSLSGSSQQEKEDEYDDEEEQEDEVDEEAEEDMEEEEASQPNASTHDDEIVHNSSNAPLEDQQLLQISDNAYFSSQELHISSKRAEASSQSEAPSQDSVRPVSVPESEQAFGSQIPQDSEMDEEDEELIAHRRAKAQRVLDLLGTACQSYSQREVGDQSHISQLQFAQAPPDAILEEVVDEPMEGVVMSAANSQRVAEASQQSITSQLDAVQDLIRNGRQHVLQGHGVRGARPLVEAAVKKQQTIDDMALALEILSHDVDKGQISTIDAMLHELLKNLMPMDKNGLLLKGRYREFIGAPFIDGFAFTSFENLKQEFTEVFDEQTGELLRIDEDTSEHFVFKHFLDNDIRLKSVQRQKNQRPSGKLHPNENQSIRYFCTLFQNDKELTEELLDNLAHALANAAGDSPIGHLISIDVTIDFYGFFYRQNLLDWQKMAPLIANAFNINASELSMRSMKQSNMMLQFAHAQTHVDPEVPEEESNLFRVKVYNKHAQRSLQSQVGGKKIDNGLNKLFDPQRVDAREILHARESGTTRLEISYYIYSRDQQHDWLAVAVQQRTLFIRALAREIKRHMLDQDMLYHCSTKAMLSSIFNGAQVDDLACFNQGTTFILMRHAITIIYGYNHKFFKFLGKTYDMDRATLDTSTMMEAYSIPGRTIRVYDCQPEDEDMPQPFVYEQEESERTQMLLFTKKYLATYGKPCESVQWPPFFSMKIPAIVKKTALTFADIEPIPTPGYGNAPGERDFDRAVRIYYQCKGCKQPFRSDRIGSAKHSCVGNDRFPDKCDWKTLGSSEIRRCPHCFMQLKLNQVASHVRIQHWQANKINVLYNKYSEAQSSEFRHKYLLNNLQVIPEQDSGPPDMRPLSAAIHLRAAAYEARKRAEIAQRAEEAHIQQVERREHRRAREPGQAEAE